MAMCMEHSVDPDTNLFFSEYLVNDSPNDRIVESSRTAGYERLVRRALALPRRPAMIMLQV